MVHLIEDVEMKMGSLAAAHAQTAPTAADLEESIIVVRLWPERESGWLLGIGSTLEGERAKL